MAEFLSNEISVLLLDSDIDSLFNTAQILESCNCRVMRVVNVQNAMWALAKNKHNINFVMADIQTPDLDIYTLLEITSDLRIRTILICPESDPMIITGMEHGAYMVLEKPICQQIIRTLWQHIMRERIVTLQVNRHLQKIRTREWLPTSSFNRPLSNSTPRKSETMPLRINLPTSQASAPNAAVQYGASSSEELRPFSRMGGQVTPSALSRIINEVQFGSPSGLPKPDEMQFMPSPGIPKFDEMHFGPPPGFPKRNEMPPAIANSVQRNAVNGNGLPDLNEEETHPVPIIHENYLKSEPESDDNDDVVFLYNGTPSASSSGSNSKPHH